jgi:ribonuclease E
VINDLIDMRLVSHRKDIENRFRERLKRDRARTTTLQISEFGILEMTRQRMRGSQESQHFSECPICRGRGIVQKADSVAADALRDLAALLDHDRVHRVELAVHPRIAGALLTTRRSSLTRAELSSGKRIDVRVSDAVPPDRVALYAYDVNNADIDLDRLPRGRGKQVLEVVDLGVPSRGREEADEAWAVDAQAEAAEASRKRLSEQLAAAKSAAAPAEDDLPDLSDLDEDDDDRPLGAAGRPGSEEDAAGEGGKRKRRRRRRRGKGSGEGAEGEGGAGPRDERAETSQPDDEGGEPRGDGADDVPMDDSDEGDDDADGGEVVLGPDGLPLKKKRRRRRGGRRRRKNREGGEGGTEGGRGPETADRTTTPVPGPSRDPSSGSSRGPSGGASGGAGAGRSSGQAVGRPGGSSVRREEGAAARGVPGSGPSAGGEVSRNGVGGSAEEPAKPARRALYGAGRRKLAPSEVSKIKGKKDGR